MLSLKDEGIIIEEDWNWPVSVVQLLNDSQSLFWLVWCDKKDGEHPCDCQPSLSIGAGVTKSAALTAWGFQHFEKRYQGRRR